MGTTLAERIGQSLETSVGPGICPSLYVHSLYTHPFVRLFTHSFWKSGCLPEGCWLESSPHAVDKDAGASVQCVTAQEVSTTAPSDIQPFKRAKEKVGQEQQGFPVTAEHRHCRCHAPCASPSLAQPFGKGVTLAGTLTAFQQLQLQESHGTVSSDPAGMALLHSSFSKCPQPVHAASTECPLGAIGWRASLGVFSSSLMKQRHRIATKPVQDRTTHMWPGTWN